MTSATTRTTQQRRYCSSSSSDGDSAQARAPLEQLTRVFKAHPSALQLHMALTRSLARGDAARAADLAATLAEVVQRMTTTDDGKDVDGAASQQQHHDTDATCSNDKKNAHSTACGDDDSHAAAACDGVPMPTDDDVDVDGATDAVVRTLHRRIRGTHPTALSATDQDVVDDNNTTTATTTTWSSSSARDDVDALCRRAQLCMTLLESSFETVLPEYSNNDDNDDDKNKTGRRRAGGEAAVLSDAALRSAQHEAAELRLLDAYLTRDEAQWRAQKHAVTMVVLDTARTLGLTPRDLLVAEQEQQQQAAAHAGSLRQSSRLNVLRHCNLVVRGEVPSIVYERAVKQQQQKQQQQCDKPDTDDAAVRARVDDEMRVLRQRMLAAGTPLSVDDERLARYELLLSHSRMRYVVGVHHSLQRALDNCDALRRAAAADTTTTTSSADADAPMGGAQYFVTRVMRALHASADELEAQHNASASSTAAAAAHATADDVTTTTTTTSSNSSALSAERIEAAGVLATPVLPFTFMLKCCLWFDVQQQQQQQSS